MSKSIEILAPGIKRLLRQYKPETSIAEYIWNGFDAKATKVELTYETNFANIITALKISDNGGGILPCDLQQKFTPFFQSNKAVEIESPQNHSLPRGKRGIGRLTFFTFAESATWITHAVSPSGVVGQKITIHANKLEIYDSIKETPRCSTSSGTTVSFSGIDLSEELFKSEVLPYLCAEFCWFLELYKEKNISLVINGQPLYYSSVLKTTEDITKEITDNEIPFLFRFRTWSVKLNQEYSKYYFINSRGEEVWKYNTSLNNKGDEFYHSLYVKSAFFDNFNWSKQGAGNNQEELFPCQGSPVFKELQRVMSRYLYNKREPYIENYTKELINNYEKEKVFPTFSASITDQGQKAMLETTVRELYKVDPQIFSGLNIQQKKAFIELLNAMLEMGADDKLLEIVAKVAKMTPEERNEFASILHYANIASISKTIGMIKDRFKTVAQLKELVFNKDLKANERDHLQKLVEKHFWLFGEQYSLVTAEEPDFEEALRRYLYILEERDEKVKIDSPDKNKEMDVFCCRKDINTDTVDNIVVELKHPLKNLSSKELEQVKLYMRTILKEDRFNAPNIFWTFYLIGNGFSEDGAIQGEFENNKNHGERSLVFKGKNHRVFVKTWSEIFSDFECRHKFILEKLELDKEKIISESKKATAALTVADARQNMAAETANHENPRPAIGDADNTSSKLGVASSITDAE